MSVSKNICVYNMLIFFRLNAIFISNTYTLGKVQLSQRGKPCKRADKWESATLLKLRRNPSVMVADEQDRSVSSTLRSKI